MPRPWGRTGWSRGEAGGRPEPPKLHPALACAPAARHLLLPPLLVLLQAPDLLKQAAPLLSQPHDLLVGVTIVLLP